MAGALLLGTGLAYELAASRRRPAVYRLAVGLALVTAFILIWASLAVGIVGSEGDPANLPYLGVLGVALAGAGVARLEPRPMARTLFATALAHVLALLVALTVWNPPSASAVVRVVGANAFFVGLWVASGRLFLRAGETSRADVATRQPPTAA